MSSRKTGLKAAPPVSKDHFSNNTIKRNFPHSSLVVRILDGTQLLASDLETGKSDPVCFVWVGPLDEHPKIEQMTHPQPRILQTSVAPTTTDPIWNEELIFPIDMSTIQLADLINFTLFVYVADYDETTDPATQEISTSYDSLGQVNVHFADIIDKGKVINGNSISLGMTKYTLEKCSDMKRIDGSIKFSVALIFGDDAASLYKQIAPDLTVNNTKDFIKNLLKQRKGELQSPVPLNTSRSTFSLSSRASTKSLNNTKIASLASFSNRPVTAPHLVSGLPNSFKLKPLFPVKETVSMDFDDNNGFELPDIDQLPSSHLNIPEDEGILLESLIISDPAKVLKSENLMPPDIVKGAEALVDAVSQQAPLSFNEVLNNLNGYLSGSGAAPNIAAMATDIQASIPLPDINILDVLGGFGDFALPESEPTASAHDTSTIVAPTTAAPKDTTAAVAPAIVTTKAIEPAAPVYPTEGFDNASITEPPPTYTRPLPVVPTGATQGNRAVTVKALKDIEEQKQILQRSLSQITKITHDGIVGLSKRLDSIEKSLSTSVLQSRKDVSSSDASTVSKQPSLKRPKVEARPGLRALIAEARKRPEQAAEAASDSILFKERPPPRLGKNVAEFVPIPESRFASGVDVLPTAGDAALPPGEVEAGPINSITQTSQGLSARGDRLAAVTPMSERNSLNKTTPGRLQSLPTLSFSTINKDEMLQVRALTRLLHC